MWHRSCSWGDAVLGEALAIVIGAVLIVLYLCWEWQQSAPDRDAREAREANIREKGGTGPPQVPAPRHPLTARAATDDAAAGLRVTAALRHSTVRPRGAGIRSRRLTEGRLCDVGERNAPVWRTFRRAPISHLRGSENG